MSDAPYIIDVTADNFMQVMQASMQTPVVLDFWAEWCSPCKALMPVLTKLADEFQGAFILAKVNIDENQQLAAQAQVRSVPTVLLVHEGQVVDQFNGALPESKIREFLKPYLPEDPSDQIREQVAAFVAAGELDQAQHLLNQAMLQWPEEIHWSIDLARLLIQRGQAQDARAILDQLSDADKMNPEVKGLFARMRFSDQAPTLEEIQALGERQDAEALYKKAMFALLQGEEETALQHLLQVMREDASYNNGIAHKTLLDVFNMLGDKHPLTLNYRRKLFTLLY
ncbi:putative thioredoxin [Allopseudospirillum japonicum]|uniref:Thioredoxin n=1 Tax=Allopseudospirillum japonicum TaxID=64971 RepID=A0A1H6R6Y0_9GAMM|nr:thioredoxin [Allopseudospirillum japonicum]SEI47385.1 putative thioredoxin [Allopseudospirillum japonicum]